MSRVVLVIFISQLFLMGFVMISIIGSSQETCDNLQPTDNQLDLEVSDAELRTDQDFSCNFNARICPIVFSDDNQDGIRDSGDATLEGITVTLSDPSETTIYYTIETDGGENTCFEPLADGQSYLVRVTTPPTPFLTTGSETATYTIDSGSGIQTPLFGYSNGEIDLNVPSSLTFPSQATSSIDQTASVTLSYVEVIDTRVGSPGFSVTATVDNFESIASNTIPIADAFTSTPQSINVISGQTSGLTPGSQKTVTSISDPFTVMEASSGNGTGTYQIDDVFDLIVPAFTPADTYNSVITFTVI
ncbi:hypothetical protein HC864_04490 [Candidatus Gracilibacteria bacterium]|nr:hypothetical protein [Candidatus Gracilibacteria bacterium]